MFSMLAPSASKTAFTFSKQSLVCSLISPLSNSPFSGLKCNCPDVKIILPALIACEYGPTAAGALFVAIISNAIFSPPFN